MNYRIIFFFFVSISYSLLANAQFDKTNNVTDAKGLKQGAWVKTDATTNAKIYEGSFVDDNPFPRHLFLQKIPQTL